MQNNKPIYRVAETSPDIQLFLLQNENPFRISGGDFFSIIFVSQKE